MKGEKWITSLLSALLAFCLAFGGMGCIATAFQFHNADMLRVALVVGTMALVFGFCFRLELGWIPMGGYALLLVFLWVWGDFAQSMEYLLYHISTFFDRGYGWGVLSWSGEPVTVGDPTAALCILGILVAAAVSWTVSQGQLLWIADMAAYWPMGLCMGLTDTVPSEQYLFLWLLGMVLLILPQMVRRRSLAQGNTVTAATILPLILLLGLLFLLIPRDSYDGQERAEKMGHFLMQWFHKEAQDMLPGDQGDGLITDGDQGKRVTLSNVGPKDNLAIPVMTVKTGYNGTLYLRGASYDNYDGTRWTASGRNAWDLTFAMGEGPFETYDLTVNTREPHSVLYLTYAPMADLTLTAGRVSNDNKITGYSLEFIPPTGYAEEWENIQFDMNQVDLRPYLQLPEGTKEAALQLISNKIGTPTYTPNAAQNWRNACTVAEFVRGSASYSLQTPLPPEGTEDFALWFLKDSTTGYCVHYATATVVLLRAVGIPARYVSGYMIDSLGHKLPQTVTMQDAHAWVECYIGGIGWVVLEPTPAAGLRRPEQSGQEQEDPIVENTEPTEPTTPDPQQPTSPVIPNPTAPGVTQSTEPEITEPQNGIGIDGQEGTEQVDSSWVPKVIGALIVVFASLSLCLGQWQLRLWLRRRKRSTGSHNHQAVYRWREMERLYRHTGEKEDQQLLEIAQKACFSQHEISSQELSLFNTARAQQLLYLQKKNLFKRLWYRLVLALY